MPVKKLLSLLLAMLLLLSGCTAGRGTESSEPPAVSTEDTETSDYLPPAPEELFALMPKDFIFTGGAGASGTELHLAEDGSFTGEFYDTDMGDNGEGYPDGTHYYCYFSGRFSQPVQVNDHTFSTHVIELIQEGESGEVTYEYEMRFICSEPVGLVGADEVLIYCPNTPTAELSEELLFWMWAFGRETLNCYGLCNVNEELGFTSYEYKGDKIP